MAVYEFSKLCNSDLLTEEVSTIIGVLERIDTVAVPPTTKVYFQDDLSEENEALLWAIVMAHNASAPPPSDEVSQVIGNNLVYEEMGSKTGGLAKGSLLGSLFSTLYAYQGSGVFRAFQMDFSKDVVLKFAVDGKDIFGAEGLDLSSHGSLSALGIVYEDFSVSWRKFPIVFSSNIVIQAKASSPVGTKFLAGLALRS